MGQLLPLRCGFECKHHNWYSFLRDNTQQTSQVLAPVDNKGQGTRKVHDPTPYVVCSRGLRSGSLFKLKRGSIVGTLWLIPILDKIIVHIVWSRTKRAKYTHGLLHEPPVFLSTRIKDFFALVETSSFLPCLYDSVVLKSWIRRTLLPHFSCLRSMS